jgi:prolyl-tRNA synthetase
VIERTELATTVDHMHTQGQEMLLEASSKRLRENTVACETIDDVGRAIEDGKFALYEWDGNPQMEIDIKEQFKATTRCIPFEGQFTDDLLKLKNPENVRVVIARSF